MSSKKGQSPFELEQYSTAGGTASDERKQLFENAHTDTDTDTEVEEAKTTRMFLLVRPSVAEKIKKAAKKQRLSANELIHRLMENYIEENDL